MYKAVTKHRGEAADVTRRIRATALPYRSRQTGFTLLELVVTTTIFAILTAIAVPSFESVMTNNTLATSTNELVASLQHARSEAVTRGQNVNICVANATLTGCSGGADWSDGWVILDNALNVIRVHEPLVSNYTMSEQGIVGGAGSIVFNRNGFTASARTIKLCGPKNKAKRARGVVISVVGQVRLAGDNNGNDIAEDRAGADFSCP